MDRSISHGKRLICNFVALTIEVYQLAKKLSSPYKGFNFITEEIASILVGSVMLLGSLFSNSVQYANTKNYSSEHAHV